MHDRDYQSKLRSKKVESRRNSETNKKYVNRNGNQNMYLDEVKEYAAYASIYTHAASGTEDMRMPC